MARNWYVVHTYSGFEEKVKTSLEEKIEKGGLNERITRILIPMEKVVEVRAGKKREADRKYYPGYILVEMELDEETWHAVKDTPRVTGFVGGQNPVPVPDEEIDQIIQQMEKGPAARVTSKFEAGDTVRITDGPFTNFTGLVDEVDAEHDKLRVLVSIFSRQTPVELHFYQVEKA